MKDNFTFVIITYNQERLVIECLESIKYQIEHYGKDKDCYFILADDCSKDNTVSVVKTWMSQNGSLFREVKYLVPEKNQGIVANFTTAYKNIKTEAFKTVSGDDILSNTNMFDLPINNRTMLIAPVFSIVGKQIVTRDFHKYRFCKAIQKEDDLKHYFRKALKYYFPISSVGMTFSHDCIDDGFFESLGRFKWMEDIAIFDYLINRDDLNIQIINKPLNIYRDTVGISKNKGNEMSGRLKDDYNVLRSQIYTSNKLTGVWYNPIRYLFWLKRFFSLNVTFNINKKVRDQYKRISELSEQLEIYYDDIKNKSDNWTEQNRHVFTCSM